MTRVSGCIWVGALMILGTWAAITIGFRKNEAEKFADNVCAPEVMGIGSYKIEQDTIKFVLKYE